MTLQDEALAGSFPQASEDQWRKAVERALKGGSFDKLVAKTYDGASIDPLYRARRGARPTLVARQSRPLGHSRPRRHRRRGRRQRPGARGSRRRRRRSAPRFRRVSGRLRRGAQRRRRRAPWRMSSTRCVSITAFPSWSRIRRARRTPPRRSCGSSTRTTSSPRSPASPSASIRLARRLRHGFAPAPWSEGAKSFADRREARRQGRLHLREPSRRTPASSMRRAGRRRRSSAFALAAGLAYLRALADAGLDLDAARKLLVFRLAADADEFAGVAKFRALRALWARVEESCGLAPAPALVHAETAWRMMTAKRSVEQSAARHARGLFGGGRRRRRDHHPALHPGARRAGRLRAPPRARHAARAAGRILSPRRRRSGRRRRRLRGADRRSLRARLERVPGHRGGRRAGQGAGRRPFPGEGRRDRRRARQECRARQGQDHRLQRVSRHRRDRARCARALRRANRRSRGAARRA